MKYSYFNHHTYLQQFNYQTNSAFGIHSTFEGKKKKKSLPTFGHNNFWLTTQQTTNTSTTQQCQTGFEYSFS